MILNTDCNTTLCYSEQDSCLYKISGYLLLNQTVDMATVWVRELEDFFSHKKHLFSSVPQKTTSLKVFPRNTWTLRYSAVALLNLKYDFKSKSYLKYDSKCMILSIFNTYLAAKQGVLISTMSEPPRQRRSVGPTLAFSLVWGWTIQNLPEPLKRTFQGHF